MESPLLPVYLIMKKPCWFSNWKNSKNKALPKTIKYWDIFFNGYNLCILKIVFWPICFVTNRVMETQQLPRLFLSNSRLFLHLRHRRFKSFFTEAELFF